MTEERLKHIEQCCGDDTYYIDDDVAVVHIEELIKEIRRLQSLTDQQRKEIEELKEKLADYLGYR